MSFSFDFVESDDESQPVKAQTTAKYPSLFELSKSIPLENLPKLHTLDELLLTLVDIRLTFDNYTTPENNIVYRRELFDVKHQVMCEDTESATNDILIAGNDNDLQKNVYEGGFKSWECSYDAVDRIEKLHKGGELNDFKSYLELGCGTALPTAFLLGKYLNNQVCDTSFVLSDFNYDVLRLVSLPNILIHYAATLAPETLTELTNKEVTTNNDELLLTQEFLSRFKDDLNRLNVSISFVSGSWGDQFNQLLKPVDFIITSETIYSLETLPLLVQSLVDLVRNVGKAYVLVAAKNIYFGVGGSIHGFLEYLGGVNDGLAVEVEEVDSQLRRSIIALRK